MISIYEAPRDAALPQLATVLDIAAMRAIFQAVYFTGEHSGTEIQTVSLRQTDRRVFQLQTCQIERVKYKPGRNCLICYRLQFCDPQTGARDEQILSARVYPLGRSASRFRKAQARLLVQPKIGPPLLHLPALGMVAWGFPNDRKLTGLGRLMDPLVLQQELLPSVVAAHFGDDRRIVDATPALAHYAPEYTCTVRVRIQLQQPRACDTQTVVLFAKTYYDDRGAETDRLMRALWASTARTHGHLRMAQPLGYHRKLKVLWQQGLTGTTLQAYAPDCLALYPWLGRAAQAVAALHQAPVACNRSIHLDDWVAKLQEMRHFLPGVWPSCRAQVASVVDRLLHLAAQLEQQPVVLVHGDLHLKNFFVDGNQIALIDLDDLRLGSPWQDIGSFMAALHYRGLLAGTSTTETERAAALFCRSYAQRVAWPISPLAIHWYTAAALVNERAFRAVTRLQCRRLDVLDALLVRAEQIIAQRG